MLYPDLPDLLSYRERKHDKVSLSHRQVSSTAAGNHHSAYRGQGLDFDAVREYVLGDDIRNIDWRVTARTGAPHLKLFKEDKVRHTILCVDMNATMRFGTRNTFKSVQAARCASWLAWRTRAHHDRLSTCLFGDVPTGMQCQISKGSSKDILRTLKMLTEAPTEHHNVSLKAAVDQVSRIAHTGSLIYLISDFMYSDPTLDLSRLSKSHQVVLIAINDPADQSLFPAGVIGFHGQGSKPVSINTDNRSGRDAYHAQWQKNRQWLSELSTQSHAQLITLSTESDIRRDLSLSLKAIARRKPCLR